MSSQSVLRCLISNCTATFMYLRCYFDAGIPSIVVRSMMMKSNVDSMYLPIVARRLLLPTQQ